MKNVLLLVIFTIITASAQNWITVGGNTQRNGLTEMTGPADVSQTFWTVSSSSSLWGNSVFTYGDKFITSRVTFSPVYSAKLECRSLTDGSLYWEKVLNDSAILYAVGFNEFAVYTHDYKTGILYSLSPADGSINWSIAEDMFGGKSGVLFACNGDPIIKGKRLDKYTGAVVWSYNYIVPVGPDAGYAMYGNTYYHWHGSIVTPKVVFALDAETGQFKYESVELAGDGDQEVPLTIGSDGTIYIPRDGGPLYAIEDNGSALNVKWQYTPISAINGYLGSDSTGNVYLVDGGKLRRLNKVDGTLMDTSLVEITTGFLPTITVDTEGKVYLCTADAGPGKYYCFSPDLQTLYWEMSMPYNYYCAPVIGKEGVMVLIGSGNEIKSYKSGDLLKPVADFYADSVNIMTGDSINFFDQSSYIPDTWQWHFEGGTPDTSNEQNPQNIIYNQSGTFTVTLTASNSLGSDWIMKECYINVEQSVNVDDFTQTPIEFYLYQNYPNPFNPATKIKYQVPNGASNTTLKVFDMLGNEVAVLVNGNRPAGTYEVNFDAAELPSGIYFYELRSGNYTDVQ